MLPVRGPSALASKIVRALPRVASSSVAGARPLLPIRTVPHRTFDAAPVFGAGNYMQPSQTNMSVSRVFADINTEANRAEWDYDAFTPTWGGQDDYEIVSKLGRGKYSEVFAGVHLPTDDPVVVKILKPVKSRKIQREVLVLRRVAGGPNIAGLRETVMDPVSKTCSLILDYTDGNDFKTLYPTLTDKDVRFYLFQLLRGLHHAHSHGVMHRDIKPHNVMIDHHRRRLSIIDWGLAEFYHAGYEYNVRVASRYFKGPELLVNMKDYDYSLDLWSFGCMMAEMVFLVHPLFQGKDNIDQLVRIAKVLGTDSLRAYLAKYGVTLDAQIEKQVGDYPIRPWGKFVNESNRHLAVPEAVDLLSKVLVMDHAERLTAQEAMQHPYFDEVRAAQEQADAEAKAAAVGAEVQAAAKAEAEAEIKAKAEAEAEAAK